MYNLKESKELFNRASNSLVGSVNSPVRAFKSVGGQAVFIDKAQGPYIFDVDGNKYIDYVGSYGPMIVGHAHKQVLNEVQIACEKSFTFGASGEKEIELAELIKEAIPSLDKVRFVNSGTEAVFSALRLARAFTGRDKILKFSGCYHGHADALLVEAGSGVVTLGLPGSQGVPEKAVKDTLVAPFNDLLSVEGLFNQFNNEIAAVIIEPVAGNMGVVLPNEGYLKALKNICEKHGALLIADEVMTGFRAHFGAAHTLYDIDADIVCLGKVIGGGFPVGAYAARSEIMDLVAPLGPVYQAGTLSGNPIAMTAGIETLKLLKKGDLYGQMSIYAENLELHLLDTANKYSVPLSVNRFGSMISAFFQKGKVCDFQQAQDSDTEMFARYFWSMMKEGIFLPPSQFEACFLSSAMDEDCMQKTMESITKTFKDL